MDYRIKQIPSGDLGTDATVQEMEKLIRDGVKEPLVRELALGLVRGIAPKDYMGEIARIFRWVQQNIRYTKDPVALELLQSARRILQGRAGDCDDFTILTSALLQAIGHQTRIKTIAVRPGEYHHVYPEVFVQGEWLPLDASQSLAIPGWQPPGIQRQKIYGGLMGLGKYVQSRANPFSQLKLGLQTNLANRAVDVNDLRKVKALINQGNIPAQAKSKAGQLVDMAIRWIEEHPNYSKVQSLAGMEGLGNIFTDAWNFVKGSAGKLWDELEDWWNNVDIDIKYPVDTSTPQQQSYGNITLTPKVPWYYQLLEPPTVYFLLGGVGLVALLLLKKRRR